MNDVATRATVIATSLPKEPKGTLSKLGKSLQFTLLRARIDSYHSWMLVRGFFNRHRWKLLSLTLLAVATFLLVLLPNDLAIFKTIRGDKDPGIRQIAQNIGWWGSFAQYNFLIVGILWITGKIRKSRYLQRLAAMTMVCTFLAGIFCNIYRFSLGRARPFTNQGAMQFHGPQPSPKFHGFPSGHTSTAFGTAIPVLCAAPQIGVPVTVFAVAMGWARIYDKQHFLGDVFVGAFIGTVFGVAGGMPLRKYRPRRRKKLA